MCLDCVFCPPRGSGQETDLWHTGTRSHWGGQYIWLHWGRACWSSRLCRSDTRHRWTLEGTDTEGNPEVTGSSSSTQLHCQELPTSKSPKPPKQKLSKPACNGIIKHTQTHHIPDVAPYPTHPPKVQPSSQRSLSLKTEMAKPNRNKADGAQVVDSMPVCKTESPPIKIFEVIKAKYKTTE